MKLKEPLVNLFSFGISVKFDIIMSGESTFYIFTRLISEYSNDTILCYINKDLDTQRKFLNFGLLDKNNNNFFIKTLRKQEIPKNGNLIYFNNNNKLN
jgi:hypothetical protein